MSLRRIESGIYAAGSRFRVVRELEPFVCARSHKLRDGSTCMGGKLHSSFLWRVYDLESGAMTGEFRSLRLAKDMLMRPTPFVESSNGYETGISQ